MNDRHAYCPREDCGRNRNGFCFEGLPLLSAYPTNATNMVSGAGMLAPFTPPVIPLGIMAMSDDPDRTGDGDLWENCAYWRQHDQRR